MGDRFTQSLRIIKAPDEAEPPVNSADALTHTDPFIPVAEILSQLWWGSDGEFETDNWSPANVRSIFAAGDTFTVDEGRSDELKRIGQVLSDNGFWWEGWVDAKYEYDGEYFAYTPELGLFHATTNGDGSLTIPLDTVDEWIAAALIESTLGSAARGALSALYKRVFDLRGDAWTKAFAPHKKES